MKTTQIGTPDFLQRMHTAANSASSTGVSSIPPTAMNYDRSNNSSAGSATGTSTITSSKRKQVDMNEIISSLAASSM